MTKLHRELTPEILRRLIIIENAEDIPIGWINDVAKELLLIRADWEEEITALQDCINDAMGMINPGCVEMPFPEDFIIALKSFIQEHHAYAEMIELLQKNRSGGDIAMAKAKRAMELCKTFV